jgi:uncharacterized protein
MEAAMRKWVAGCGLLAGALVVLAQSPSAPVSAAAKATPQPSGQQTQPAQASPKPSATAAKIDPAKETDIRQLMQITGVDGLGEQLINAGIAQFRANVNDSQPDNPRAKQFVDAFAAHFQKHFDTRSLTETVIPIYDKYLTSEDLKELLQYYKSPFGQRMLKVLPQVARDSQLAGYQVGQKAADEAMEELKTDFPEFMPKDEEKHPGPSQ